MSLIVLFSTIHDPTVLFQLTFTFIYSTFNNKFSVSTNKKKKQYLNRLKKTQQIMNARKSDMTRIK